MPKMRENVRQRLLPRLWIPCTEHPPPNEKLASPKPADDSPVIPAHASSSSSDWTGKKPKKPFYKKPWFIVIVVILILAAIGSMGGKNDAEDSGPSGTNEAQNESLSD